MNYNNSMTREEIEKEKQVIVSHIEKYVPLMREFFETEKTVREYSAALYDFAVNPIHQKRQKLIKKVISSKLVKLFGQDALEKLQVNLDAKLAFNIADHHQVLNHPLLISANYISSVEKFGREKKQDAIIVVSSGDVPPNNYFSKGGFQMHDKRVPIFSVSEREFCSFYVPERDFNFIQRLKKADRWKEFTDEEKKFLEKEYEKIQSFDYAGCENYCDQITVIVKNTWPYLFEEKLRSSLPELLYITQEESTLECLKEILKQDDNFISRTLFEPSLRNAVLNNFRGIVVTWRENENKGTHFFWRKYPDEPRSLRMYVQGSMLVPVDLRFKELAVPLQKDIILELLEKREIYPSLFMIFSVLNFYLGVKPLTGFGSRVYLELFKQAWLKTLKNSDFKKEMDLIDKIQTSGFVAGLAIFFKRVEGVLKTLYAHDIFYDGGVTKEYLDIIAKIKFRDLMQVAVADIYDYYSQEYVPPQEKIKPQINFDDLATITFDWIK